MPKLPTLRLRPRSWRDLFAAMPPPDATAWLSPLAESDPSPKDFWSELAKAADPKFEHPKAQPNIAVEKLQQQLKDAGAFIGRDQKVPEGL